MTKVQGQICSGSMSQKNLTCVKRNPPQWRHKTNLPEIYKLEKLNPHKEKFITIEAQGQMCLSCMNREDSTYMK
ncbi:hypothetical protein B296_00054373 [Ensete ventricosum]|uniref:Uncharacterized protein n=1 Tax=Ensete ventricosum TaxID=4639 RepID=A0A426XIF7_ENSVE|nr:hypothetical protein B296_00054373 [Ensete ventricosum]